MENISEKKKGRPKLIDGEFEKTFKAIWNTRTRRNLLNRHYMQKAFGLLTDLDKVLPGFEYLFGGSNDLNNANMKMTIISELGRLQDSELIREFAREICEHKIPTRKAVQRIRNYRLGRTAAVGDTQSLIDEIIKTVNGFYDRYPGTEESQVQEALSVVAGLVG